jgi:hypothetical protein
MDLWELILVVGLCLGAVAFLMSAFVDTQKRMQIKKKLLGIHIA